jgi:NAD(P)-dependent dehydrogenase (short-subunit alcohol dehydrogenase family)
MTAGNVQRFVRCRSMNIERIGALVVGGASGLGAATVKALRDRGARVAVADLKPPEGGGEEPFFETDVQDEEKVKAAVEGAVEALGELRFCVNCAGVGWAERAIGREGPANPVPFATVLGVNLIGMYTVLRHAAWAMSKNEPDEGGERGAFVMTASIAAFDGQIGQTAYSASKGGIVGLTLPAARDLARLQIRVCTIAPGTFDTPLLAALPQEARDALGASIPHPSRLGRPDEFAALAVHIAENSMLNGETIRLDGALRMPPK